MVPGQLPQLCTDESCRLLQGHAGNHNPCPTSAWSFLLKVDQDKLAKAGFATPRGGAKGAYQNHVLRSNRVIVPYERLQTVPIGAFGNGYTVRLLPEQYFKAAGQPKPEFLAPDSAIHVGTNAFVLYRTHRLLNSLPPMADWQVCHLEKDGQSVTNRTKGVVDVGHYVLRIPRLGEQPARSEGVVQGIFAPEYADEETNYLCKCVLAWLTIHTLGSPYTSRQAKHLATILAEEGLLDAAHYEFRGVMRHALCSCPLCLRLITYEQLHEMVTFDTAGGNENASEQVVGATRSTIVNLFHLLPLAYDTIRHIPQNVAWGHALCNTRLGQRPCYSLAELIQSDRKLGVISPEGIETFGWISADDQMIRSPGGAVWILLNGDMGEDEMAPPTPVSDIVGGEP